MKQIGKVNNIKNGGFSMANFFERISDFFKSSDENENIPLKREGWPGAHKDAEEKLVGLVVEKFKEFYEKDKSHFCVKTDKDTKMLIVSCTIKPGTDSMYMISYEAEEKIKNGVISIIREKQPEMAGSILSICIGQDNIPFGYEESLPVYFDYFFISILLPPECQDMLDGMRTYAK